MAITLGRSSLSVVRALWSTPRSPGARGGRAPPARIWRSPTGGGRRHERRLRCEGSPRSIWSSGADLELVEGRADGVASVPADEAEAIDERSEIVGRLPALS